MVLVNSNPATIMTDPELADATYIEPVHWKVVAQIIEKERPDALLPTMGGQTGLNCSLDLAREGVLDAFGVELVGANREAIDKAEDRELFRAAMAGIGLACPRATLVRHLEQATAVQADLGFPAIIRPSFTLGGTGGGIAYNREEFAEICERGLRDEPAGLSILGPRLEGDGISHRPGRRQARGRLYPRRARQRDHRPSDAGVVRVFDRLRRHQDPAIRLREVPAGRLPADDPDEVRG